MSNETELARLEKQLGLPPYKPWYKHGRRAPRILYKRLQNKYAPLFRLRMAWQRATRGHGDDDLWNLNHAVAKLVVAGCKAMREWGHGYPAELSESFGYEGGDGFEKWMGILQQIEDGFQTWLDNDGWFYDKPEEEAKFKEGMALFSEWFSGLWD